MKKVTNLSTILMLIFGLITIISCKKSSTPKSKTELITELSWKMNKYESKSSAAATYVDFSSLFTGCLNDNTQRFYTTGNLILDGGSLKCNASDPQTTSQTWSFANNDTQIKIGPTLYNILILDNNSLIVEETGSNYPLEKIVFKH